MSKEEAALWCQTMRDIVDGGQADTNLTPPTVHPTPQDATPYRAKKKPETRLALSSMDLRPLKSIQRTDWMGKHEASSGQAT